MYKGFSSGPDLRFSGESGGFKGPPESFLILFHWRKSGWERVLGGWMDREGGDLTSCDRCTDGAEHRAGMRRPGTPEILLLGREVCVHPFS